MKVRMLEIETRKGFDFVIFFVSIELDGAWLGFGSEFFVALFHNSTRCDAAAYSTLGSTRAAEARGVGVEEGARSDSRSDRLGSAAPLHTPMQRATCNQRPKHRDRLQGEDGMVRGSSDGCAQRGETREVGRRGGACVGVHLLSGEAARSRSRVAMGVHG